MKANFNFNFVPEMDQARDAEGIQKMLDGRATPSL